MKGEAEDKMVRQHHDSMDMNLSKLWEIVKDRGAWRTQSMGWKRVGHDLATEHHQHIMKQDILATAWHRWAVTIIPDVVYVIL